MVYLTLATFVRGCESCVTFFVINDGRDRLGMVFFFTGLWWQLLSMRFGRVIVLRCRGILLVIFRGFISIFNFSPMASIR